MEKIITPITAYYAVIFKEKPLGCFDIVPYTLNIKNVISIKDTREEALSLCQKLNAVLHNL